MRRVNFPALVGLLLLAAGGIAAGNINSRPAWFIFYAFLAVLLYAFTLPLWLPTKKAVERRLSQERLTAGGSLQVELVINPRLLRLPCRITVRDHLPPRLKQCWQPVAAHAYLLVNLPRGIYHWSGITIEADDLFGLVTTAHDQPLPQRVIVQPAWVEIGEWKGLGVPGPRQHTVSRGLEDTSQVVGVREYQRGDRLNRIDWRATARTGSLKSKEFPRPSGPELSIYLDCCREHYQEADFEAAVAVAASLLRFAASAHLRGFFSYWDAAGRDKLPLPASRAEVEALGDILAGVQPNGQHGLLAAWHEELLEGHRVAVIAPAATLEMLELTRHAGAHDMLLSWMAIGPTTDLTYRATAFGAHVYPLREWQLLPEVLRIYA